MHLKNIFIYCLLEKFTRVKIYILREFTLPNLNFEAGRNIRIDPRSLIFYQTT